MASHKSDGGVLNEPGYRGRSLVETASSMILLTTLAITLRFLSKVITKRAAFWWDDWSALAAWIIFLPHCALAIDLTKHGIGRHVSALSEVDIERFQLEIYVTEILYNYSLTLTKISAICFYIRVFPMTVIWFRRVIWVAAALCIGWCITATFVGCFQCTPARKYWKTNLAGHCLPSFSVFLGVSIPNVVTDALLLIIPMPFIKNLNVGLKQKIGLFVVFATGYATLAISLTRAIVCSQLDAEEFADFPWTGVALLDLCVLEPGIGLISVCLPSQIQLFCWVWKRLVAWAPKRRDSSEPAAEATPQEESPSHSEGLRDPTLERSDWLSLSNCSYQAAAYADLDARLADDEKPQEGISVQKDIWVEPVSGSTDFVPMWRHSQSETETSETHNFSHDVRAFMHLD